MTAIAFEKQQQMAVLETEKKAVITKVCLFMIVQNLMHNI